jgi:hypothetical protein
MAASDTNSRVLKYFSVVISGGRRGALGGGVVRDLELGTGRKNLMRLKVMRKVR